MTVEKLHEALDEDGKVSKNLKSGFKKAGIFPLNKSQVLSRLPCTRDDSELISDIF